MFHAFANILKEILLVVTMLPVFCGRKRVGIGHTSIFCTVVTLGDAIIRPSPTKRD